MLPGMKRRITFAVVWFWGFWSAGATLEFFSMAPMWPALLIGLVGVAYAFGLMPAFARQHSAKHPIPQPD
jgi:hypothetical protein